MHPGFSSAVWNVTAAHTPLHAMREAATTRPSLYELAVRHKPRTRFERLQMTLALSRMFPLHRNMVTAPECGHACEVVDFPRGSALACWREGISGSGGVSYLEMTIMYELLVMYEL